MIRSDISAGQSVTVDQRSSRSLECIKACLDIALSLYESPLSVQMENPSRAVENVDRERNDRLRTPRQMEEPTVRAGVAHRLRPHVRHDEPLPEAIAQEKVQPDANRLVRLVMSTKLSNMLILITGFGQNSCGRKRRSRPDGLSLSTSGEE
jgi:hypothetical protein